MRSLHFICCSLFLAITHLTTSMSALAQAPNKEQPLTPAQQEKLKERQRLEEETQKKHADGKFAEAVTSALKMLAIERDVFGNNHPDVAGSLELLADLYELLDDPTSARQARKEVLAIHTKLLGEQHWQVTDARVALQNIELKIRLSAADRRRLREANELNQRAMQPENVKDGIPLLEKALAIRKQVHGEKHPYYAAILHNLASLYQEQGDYGKAEPLYRQALEIREQTIGEKNPRYGVTLNSLALLYEAQGNYAKAEPLCRQALEICKEALGEKHPNYAASLGNLATLYKAQGGYAKAEPLYRKALEINKEVFGDKHPKYANSLNNLAELWRAQGEYGKAEPLFHQALEIRKQVLGEKHPDYAVSLNNLALNYHGQGGYAKAEPLCRRALEIQKEVLGEKHPEYVNSLNNLAELWQAQGEYRKAEAFFHQALDIRKQALGEQHPLYATSLNNLALLHQMQAEYAKAELLYRKALDIRKQALGELHPEYANGLNNLAGLYDSKGEHPKAQPLYRQALEIRKQALGEKHPEYANGLHNLASHFKLQGDYARAEPLYRQALEIRKQALGEKHPDYADSLNTLAMLYLDQQEYAKAEPLFHQALEIHKQALGEKHPVYAISLNNLALNFEAQGKYEKAEPLFHQSLEIRKQALGEKHPDYANSLNNLAGLYRFQRNYAKAEPLLLEALHVLGEKHRKYPTSLNNLAQFYHEQGKYAKAEPFYLQAVRLELDLLHRSAAAQSEQQQQTHAQHLRTALDNWCLAAAASNTADANQIYSAILAWKGAITARQRQTRMVRTILESKPDAETARLLNDLDAVSRQLAALSTAKADSKRIEELSDRREQLERDLSRKTEAFRKLREGREFAPADLQKLLSEGTVLVDFFEYRVHVKKSPAELVAFIVTAKSIERVEFGRIEGEAEATGLADAIDQFRNQLHRVRPVLGKDDPAVMLRDNLWAPLEKHLAGAKLILISPDGPLNRLPFAALPTKDGERYLIEDYPIAILPVPQLLPELLARRDKPESPSLLLVGDVDYDLAEAPIAIAAAGASRPPAGEPMRWERLDGARREINALDETFKKAVPNGKLTVLRNGKASETAFRQLAPKFDYLHLATHGFFAPEKLKSTLQNNTVTLGGDLPRLVGYHPGLLSGVVLAGANKPKENDDGVLTALEVGDLDLTRAELVVLSACETGLGEVAGGEGVLGLQRAFQVAGAKTTVTSLWKVPDEATQALMVRFQESHWQGRDGKRLGKLEALREAQLWLLKEGAAKNPELVRSGFKFKEKEKLTWKPGDPVPPYFWAAFALSGDWR